MFSLKTKQIAGVTLIVGATVVVLSGWYLTSLAGIWLSETQARADLLTRAVVQRAFDAVLAGGDPVETLRSDGGLHSILQASIYSRNVVYAAIVDANGRILAHSNPDSVGQLAAEVPHFDTLTTGGPLTQWRAIYATDGPSYEVRQPLLLNDRPFGSVRVGVSTLLLREQVETQMRTPLVTTTAAILLASLAALLLTQLTVRPIHVIRSGLARLGRGELDVRVDLPRDAELDELGDSFKAVSARLAAERSESAGQRATLESLVDNLEDAVALFSPAGALLFANAAMRPALTGSGDTIASLLPAAHPYRRAVESALATSTALAPTSVRVPGGGERLVLVHPVADGAGHPLGVLLLARNLTYLSQVESTLTYSRKLAALGRLSAGIAHEVKNPLNATMIHLELLKMQVADSPAALEHVAVIAAQVRRLDEVVQGFLKFTRPEDLRLQPVAVGPLVRDVLPIVQAEAETHHIEVRVDIPADLPAVSADPALLQQAFLNLAINACQAMPNGGRLRIAGAVTPDGRVEVLFEDTGIGMPPEHLDRIFDLYFTTKEHGTGIGLSLVYRTVQLHDGEIEVQSVPGRGTTFRVLLRQAPPEAGWTSTQSGILGLREA